MAKRRKEKDEDEDKPFKLPKFDEEAFLKKERRNIKATFIAFLFGVLMALICFGFYALMSPNDPRWILVLLVAIFSASFIRYIYDRIHLDMTDFTRRNWFSSFAIYLFTWMIILIVLVNPPFYDDEAPIVEVAVLPDMQELGGTVKIVAKITDNSGITNANIDLEITSPDGTSETPAFQYKDNILRYTFDSPDNLTSNTHTYNYRLTVTDNSGRTNEKTGSFSYSNDTINLALPDSGDEVKAASPIRFSVQPDVNRVYYTVDKGNKINVTKSVSSDFYETNPSYIGWPQQNNITVTVNVTGYVVYYFENSIEDFNNTIADSQSYTFLIDPDENENYLGITTSEEISLPGPHYVSAPGFELIVFIVSLAAVILIFKYKKKDKRH
jgi:hypothetical protein